MIIMKVYKKVYLKILKRINPLKFAKEIGVTIGEKCKLNDVPSWGSEPWLIKIGNHVEISFGVTFITHDGATWVFRDKEKYKDVIKYGKIVIGNNCFIGANSTILPGVEIGDNSIVGSCSLVNKKIPSGEVWGGYLLNAFVASRNMLRNV